MLSRGKGMPEVTQQAEPPSLGSWVQCSFQHTNCSHAPTNISHTLRLDCQDAALSPELGGSQGPGEGRVPFALPVIPCGFQIRPSPDYNRSSGDMCSSCTTGAGQELLDLHVSTSHSAFPFTEEGSGAQRG